MKFGRRKCATKVVIVVIKGKPTDVYWKISWECPFGRPRMTRKDNINLDISRITYRVRRCVEARTITQNDGVCY